MACRTRGKILDHPVYAQVVRVRSYYAYARVSVFTAQKRPGSVTVGVGAAGQTVGSDSLGAAAGATRGRVCVRGGHDDVNLGVCVSHTEEPLRTYVRGGTCTCSLLICDPIPR